MTFSANDMGWDDAAIVLEGRGTNTDEQLDEFLKSLDPTTRKQLFLSDQVRAARHFLNRWKAFMEWLEMDPSHPIGDIQDYFWRIEFQLRGSPHVHMLVWIR